MTKQYAVVVLWLNPRGYFARSGKMLTLPVELTEEGNLPYRYSNDVGDTSLERYIFAGRSDAEEFKSYIEKNYKPEYFVIDDEGDQIVDADGDPIVAWVPDLTIVEIESATVST